MESALASFNTRTGWGLIGREVVSLTHSRACRCGHQFDTPGEMYYSGNLDDGTYIKFCEPCMAKELSGGKMTDAELATMREEGKKAKEEMKQRKEQEQKDKLAVQLGAELMEARRKFVAATVASQPGKNTESDKPARTLVIMRGLPGSGKSTCALAIADIMEANLGKTVICSADDFFRHPEDGGRFHFEARLLGAAHAQCKAKFDSAVRARTPCVIIDNTNSTATEYADYCQWAETMGYRVRVLEVPCATVSQARRFHKRCTKKMPFDVHERMMERWQADARSIKVSTASRDATLQALRAAFGALEDASGSASNRKVSETKGKGKRKLTSEEEPTIKMSRADLEKRLTMTGMICDIVAPSSLFLFRQTFNPSAPAEAYPLGLPCSICAKPFESGDLRYRPANTGTLQPGKPKWCAPCMAKEFGATFEVEQPKKCPVCEKVTSDWPYPAIDSCGVCGEKAGCNTCWPEYGTLCTDCDANGDVYYWCNSCDGECPLHPDDDFEDEFGEDSDEFEDEFAEPVVRCRGTTSTGTRCQISNERGPSGWFYKARPLCEGSHYCGQHCSQQR